MEMWSIILIVLELLLGALIGVVGYMFKNGFDDIKLDLKELRKDVKDEIKDIKHVLQEHANEINEVKNDISKIKFAHNKQHNEII